MMISLAFLFPSHLRIKRDGFEVRRVVRLLALLIFCILAVSTRAEDAIHPSVIEFREVEFIYSDSTSIPSSGWQKQDMPFEEIYEAENAISTERKTAWVRFNFENVRLGHGPYSLTINTTSERFIVHMNGEEVFRNFTDRTQRNFASVQPHLVSIPANSIQSGQNELVIRLESEIYWTVLINGVRLGPDVLVRPNYERRYLLQFQAPQLINAVLGTMTILTFLFWLVRPKETVFGWLAAVGMCWFVRNLHYSILTAPIDPNIIWEIAIIAPLLLLFTFTGFATSFFNLKHSKIIMICTTCFTIVIIGSRYLLQAFEVSGFFSDLATIPVVIGLTVIYARESWLHPRAENIVMFLTILIAFGATYHDFSVISGIENSIDFYLMPYASLVVFLGFSFALGRRLLTALSLEENMTAILADRVQAATETLAASEAERRNLQVLNAVTLERDRMMREIHDGIGSSLVTALAVAEHQGQSPDAVVSLKSALTDLRVAVDSLEPYGGDLANLLASLRYRIEPDLTKVGLAFEWQVEIVPELAWLDATNALHIMRIFQQVISNIVEHADATLITVGCREVALNDVDGLEITIADNGVGFDPDKTSRGRGLNNMSARAEALHAVLSVKDNPPGGTLITLWLPLHRTSLTDQV
ncbi:MAG: ATP-binding protein [Rhizobiaceae bacterium]